MRTNKYQSKYIYLPVKISVLISAVTVINVQAHSGENIDWQGWDEPETTVVDEFIRALISPVEASALISIAGKYRVIKSNALPDHETGKFPNRNNPNSIQSKNLTYRVPATPQQNSFITRLGMSPFGVALNGVPFDPNAAEFWQGNRQSGWQYEALSGKINLGLDSSSAHVQPDGTYHYHGLPKKMLVNSDKQQLLGYAADGFAIYSPIGYQQPMNKSSALIELRTSYKVKSGTRPSGPKGKYDGSFVADYEYQQGLGELDQCNGRFGITAEYPQGSYYYVISNQFPFIPRCFKGTPDNSFDRTKARNSSSNGARSGSANGARKPPAQAIAACKNKSVGSKVSFKIHNRNVQGICRSRHNQKFAVPLR